MKSVTGVNLVNLLKLEIGLRKIYRNQSDYLGSNQRKIFLYVIFIKKDVLTVLQQ